MNIHHEHNRMKIYYQIGWTKLYATVEVVAALFEFAFLLFLTWALKTSIISKFDHF